MRIENMEMLWILANVNFHCSDFYFLFFSLVFMITPLPCLVALLLSIRNYG